MKTATKNKGNTAWTACSLLVLNAKATTKFPTTPIPNEAANTTIKNKPKNDNQVIELLDDIAKDLFNHDLELRIQELESKFSKDLSETTFNELKELKNERKTN